MSNTSLYKPLVVVECNPFWFTTTKINALLALWKFAKYYVGNFHNPSLIVQEICIRCNWQQFYFNFLPHSLGFIHSKAKTEHEWWRSPEDENNHQPLDLQPKCGGPDQHLVQQHLQLHLHEEQVPALNSTSTYLRGLRNVPNFLNSQSWSTCYVRMFDYGKIMYRGSTPCHCWVSQSVTITFSFSLFHQIHYWTQSQNQSMLCYH